MILSVSRRTDIPCHYAEWFMHRIREGRVLTRNPMNHAKLYEILLSPEIVDCIVFWTKDPQPMLPHLDELDAMGYMYYFTFTVTPYDRTVERGLRPKSEIVETFRTLSARLSKQRVLWRCDPFLVTDAYPIERQKAEFATLCAALAPYTDTVTVSFVDLYAKRKATGYRPLTDAEIDDLAPYLAACAKQHGLRITACCEPRDLTAFGIERAACIDRSRIERLLGCPLSIKPDRNQRQGCGCCESVDIGVYNTCPNGCIYCYATDSAASAARRHASHDPYSPLLVGRVGEGETAIPRSGMHSCKMFGLI